MSEVLEKKWYVVRAVSGQENKIKGYIESEVERHGFADYLEEVLVPTEKVVQIRNGKKINKERVYFPGYIMIKANLGGEMIHIIRSITNVIGFLGETKGGDPVPLRKAEVNRMLGKVDELAINTDSIAIPFILGETVKVIDGPFNGFNGTVEKINEEKRKLEVMVKIFGRKTPLELSYMINSGDALKQEMGQKILDAMDDGDLVYFATQQRIVDGKIGPFSIVEFNL